MINRFLSFIKVLFKKIKFLLALVFLLGLTTLLTNCSAELSNQHTQYKVEQLLGKVIYGQDGRKQVYEVEAPEIRAWAQSTVVLMKKSKLTLEGETYKLQSSTFGQEMNLCENEPFSREPSAGFCSGFLVAPDVVATAGHCVRSLSDCENTFLIFNYEVGPHGELPTSFSSSQVYSCQDIIKQVLKPGSTDFAVLKLDKPALDRKPLKLRTEGQIQTGDDVVVVGHPSGLPTKITLGGQVRATDHSEFFMANVDTYGGNSGSAVLNLKTGLIEGILVRGEQDFVFENGCYKSKVCEENSCRGEDITRISTAYAFIPGYDHLVPPQDKPTEIFENLNEIEIPDNNETGIESFIYNVSSIQNRKVIVQFKIEHTFIGDLIVKLKTPLNREIILHSRQGGSEDSLIGEIDLTRALANTPAGDYKLTVQDVSKKDTGKLKSWSLQIF